MVAVQLLLHGRLSSVVLDGFHPLDPPRRGGDAPLVRVTVASGPGAVGHCGRGDCDQIRVPIEAGLVTVDHVVDERFGIAVATLGGVKHDDGRRLPGDNVRPLPPGQHGSVLFDQWTGLVEAALADQCHPPGTGELTLRRRVVEQVGQVADELLGFGPSSEPDERFDPAIGDPPRTGTAESGGPRQLDGSFGVGRDFGIPGDIRQGGRDLVVYGDRAFGGDAGTTSDQVGERHVEPAFRVSGHAQRIDQGVVRP